MADPINNLPGMAEFARYGRLGAAFLRLTQGQPISNQEAADLAGMGVDVASYGINQVTSYYKKSKELKEITSKVTDEPPGDDTVPYSDNDIAQAQDQYTAWVMELQNASARFRANPNDTGYARRQGPLNMRGAFPLNDRPMAAFLQHMRNTKTGDGRPTGRGPLLYSDAALENQKVLSPGSGLTQLHMTDYITEGTGMSSSRVGKKIYLQSVYMNGYISHNPLYVSPSGQEGASYILEYGIIYDRLGNAASYTHDDIWLSRDGGVGSRIFYNVNMNNVNRFKIVLRRRFVLNNSQSEEYATCPLTSKAFEHYVQLPEFETVYPDATSPPTTGEIFFYIKTNTGTTTDYPWVVYVNTRLRYYTNPSNEEPEDSEEDDQGLTPEDMGEDTEAGMERFEQEEYEPPVFYD